MRVCLINPPRIQPKLWGKPGVFQPLDIAYIAALLENQHTVSIIDAPTEGWKNLEEIDGMKYRQGLPNKEIANRVKQSSPDVVGITVPFSGWWKSAREVISVVKNVNKNIIVILSGLHPSARPRECLANPDVDFVVIGEPEQTISELVDALEQRKIEDLAKVRGIGFVNNGKAVITPPRPPIEDLNSLPFPARHLLPMNIYFEAVKENPLRGEICKPWAIMITSRGCPYDCVFCSIHNVMGKKWRGRSPQNVVEEIEQLIQTYKIEQIDFYDDNMTLNKKRMEAICDLILEKRLKVEWYTPNGVRADTLDENLLRKMKASGCKKIRIAPESGSQQVLDNIVKKNLNLKDVEKAVILSKKVGLKVGCFFVIGLVGETKKDINDTINFAYKLKSLGAEGFYFSLAMPVYGTELYEQAKKGGFLKSTFSEEALAGVEPLIETPEFTADDLLELCTRANMINQTFTVGKLVKAIREPKKAVKFLIGKK
ncbi:radical SAM protein [Candidatus Bathyarchaeota archaeon A05DMB-2]|nr:radical SAM protein [Candidatus Bathyarchaeota archaeon A05DMB-2]